MASDTALKGIPHLSPRHQMSPSSPIDAAPTRDGTGRIPEVIHQVWVGDLNDAFCNWMDTFRVDFLKENPSWRYKLWTIERFESQYGPLRNKRIFDLEPMMASKADILRYEILFHEGGVYLDADSIWIHGRNLNAVLEEASATGFFAVRHPGPSSGDVVVSSENDFPLLANGVIGVTAQHPTIARVIEEIPVQYEYLRFFQQQRHHVRTGPWLFSYGAHVSNMPVTIFPTSKFFPSGWHRDWSQVSDFAKLVRDTAAAFPDSVTFQVGYTTSSEVSNFREIIGLHLGQCRAWAGARQAEFKSALGHASKN
jgi:hypothetical protein